MTQPRTQGDDSTGHKVLTQPGHKVMTQQRTQGDDSTGTQGDDSTKDTR